MATYNIRLMDGTQFSAVPDNVMFQMLEQLNVRDVASHETGEILYQSRNAKTEERKVGGITIARDWMVVLGFIKPAGNVESYVMENKTERDAEWYLELSHDPERVATYNHEYGGLLSAVVTFEKTSVGYVQRGRVEF